MFTLSNFIQHIKTGWSLFMDGGAVSGGENNDYNNTEFHFFVGNEAADADSVVSSFVYAAGYFNDFHDNNNNNKHPQYFIPILHIPRNELELRREITLIFENVGLSREDIDVIPSIYDVRLSNNNNNNSCPKMILHLLDHNRASDIVTHIFRNAPVYSIIDHHIDVGAHPNCVGYYRWIAFGDKGPEAGSTCSLIATHANSSVDNMTVLLPALADVILLDTSNLSETGGKTTAYDVNAIQFIISSLDGKLTRDELSARYEMLKNCKSDPAFWLSLSPETAFKMDYKSFVATSTSIRGVIQHRIGISSILMSLDAFFAKHGSVKIMSSVVHNYLRVQSFFTIMTLYDDNIDSADADESVSRKTVREICFFVKQSNIKIVDFVVNFISGELGLVKIVPTDNITGVEDVSVRMFRQNNIKASRKQVIPLMTRAVESLSL